MDKVKRNKSSVLWEFFSTIEGDSNFAKCKTCKQKLSYKTSTSNLKKHMTKKHPTVAFPLPSGTAAARITANNLRRVNISPIKL